MASFLAFRLLDERPLVADPSNAQRTLLWSHRTLDWDPEMLELFALPADPLPTAVPSLHRFGTLRAGGLAIPLTVMTGDQPASLHGSGPIDAEALYVNVGTGGFVQRLAQSFADAPPRLLATVVLQDTGGVTFAAEGTVHGAAAALRWAEEALGLERGDAGLRLAAEPADEVQPPLFLNGVSGLGSPFWVPELEPRFVGAAGVEGKLVAVLESIVFLLQVNIEELRRTGPAPRRIRISGGLAGLDGLCRRLADLAGLPVERPALAEATARGVGHLLAGRPDSWREEVGGDRFAPAGDDALRERFGRWREAMRAAIGSG